MTIKSSCKGEQLHKYTLIALGVQYLKPEVRHMFLVLLFDPAVGQRVQHHHRLDFQLKLAAHGRKFHKEKSVFVVCEQIVRGCERNYQVIDDQIWTMCRARLNWPDRSCNYEVTISKNQNEVIALKWIWWKT